MKYDKVYTHLEEEITCVKVQKEQITLLECLCSTMKGNGDICFYRGDIFEEKLKFRYINQM